MNDKRAPITLRAAQMSGATAPPPTHEITITSTRRVRPGAARDAGAAALTVAPDEVVRVEHDNGLVLWMRADDLLRERGRKAVARGDGSEAWDIDGAPRIGAFGESAPAQRGERGALGLGIKALEFFGVDLKKKTAAVIGKAFEERQLKGASPGRLHRCDLASAAPLVPVADPAKHLPGATPLLVFLHGTMSSARGSFGDLWATSPDEAGKAAAAAREAIKSRYGSEVYAFEHRTLTESPIRNALALVEQLPHGALLHLVSHSRGGLVGELLCLAERERRTDPLRPELLEDLFKSDRTIAAQIGLGPLDSEAAKARDAAYKDDRIALAALLKALDAKQITVRRFVRVACPARGTTLASGRLDRWLSVINLLTGNGLVGDVADFLLAVVKQRTDPRTLPGVEAMMPGSALTQLLHHPDLVTSADLSVIGGDVEGDGLWAQLKLLAVDWFYGAEHDLVVNTGSMMGGLRRPEGGARFLRDQGPKVTHFNYFGNRKSLGWMVSGLARDEASAGGYLPITQAAQEEPRWRAAVRASRSTTTPRPIAVVIPGTMGSMLEVEGRPVWLDYWALLRGGLGDIGWGASGVEPVGLLDDFYGPLLEHLARTHRVEVLPYDWRNSVREAAKRLAAKLEAVLPDAERLRQPVHLVAHSMGGLVARAMIADGDAGAQAWRRLTALPGSRLLMLGTPNLGSHEAVRWLTGSNPTQAKLILLDFTRDANGVIDVVRRFPGVAELLPFDQEHSPWAQVATWRALKAQLGAGWTTVEDGVLRQAAATWKLLRQAEPDPERMVYVAGCQDATVIGHEVVEEEFGFARKKLQWIATRDGDGTVPWTSGRLSGVPTWYAPETGHDQLCSNSDDQRIFRGYVDLLLTGKTDQLSSTPPGGARAAGESSRFVLPELPVADDIPDAATLRGLGFGGTRARRRRPGAVGAAGPLRVSIRHGDLRYARFPVLVGHYEGDVLVGTEAFIDDQLSGLEPVGPLRRARDMGLYPGPCGSHAVFFNEQSGRPPYGAVVVGLGLVGELAPSRLELSVCDALLHYAQRLAERAALTRPAGGTPVRVAANVSCLLVGSSGANALRVRDSMESILRGALGANRRIEAIRLDHKVVIEHLEFVEMYEDVAMLAAYELDQIIDSGREWSRLDWSERVVTAGEGGRAGRGADSEAGWLQRVDISEDRKADRLKFVVTANRARAEESLAAGQLRLADDFIARACASVQSDSDLSKTLFEMLVPLRLKESVPDQRDTVLVVDEVSARFPWELLEDRWSKRGRPLAVASGLVRQLRTGAFREKPAYAVGNTAYVVGNPNLGGWDRFDDLPGAREEAGRVQQVLHKAGFDVADAIDASSSTIIERLHAKPWRVLHLAGHGEHEYELELPPPADAPTIELPDGGLAKRLPQRRTVSGMVIGNRSFLTPGDVEQMRYVPELVFVNCCHLGKTENRVAAFNKLAANLGVQFIRMGVRAVVCAGWAVEDRAALVFAETFYGRMARGDSFMAAVQQARQAAYDADPNVNTWGAYQCYGDAAYCLVKGDAVRTRAWPDYVSPSELVRELNDLAESARSGRKHPGHDDNAVQDRLRESIEARLARIPEICRGNRRDAWLKRADVCAAVGFAYGEGLMFEDAVEWLDKALAGSVGDCPVRAVEQCANFRVRLAARAWSDLRATAAAGSVSPSDLRVQQARLAERIEDAISELDLINMRSPSAGRLTLLGSACKRLAWVQTEPGPRVEALLNMAQYYRDAFDARQQDDCYSFNNWAVACLLLEALDADYRRGDWHGTLADLCEAQIKLVGRRNDENPSLWAATGLGDLEVVQLLLAAADPPEAARRGVSAGERYAAAFARGASPREIASIREHIDFLIELTAAWSKAVRDALQSVRRAI